MSNLHVHIYLCTKYDLHRSPGLLDIIIKAMYKIRVKHIILQKMHILFVRTPIT
jgi:hypothetical protein